MGDFSRTIEKAKEVLELEAESIRQLTRRLDESFARAVEVIYRAKGRVIVTGIGKSGIIGKKIAATLTSTGTPAIFLHPVEGMHGDIGIVTKDDVIIAISNSGETHELNLILQSVREMGPPSLPSRGTHVRPWPGRQTSSSTWVLRRRRVPGLAPTSSTTATLAMGDALAVSLIEKRNFTEHDFYKFHPGGTLGLRLRAKVRDIMIRGEEIPRVYAGTP